MFKKSQSSDEQPGGDFQPREMHQGDWECADCGAKITELPFKPDADRPIYCRDCWRKRRERFRR